MHAKSKSWYKKWWGILLIFFITLILIILIASGLYIFNTVKGIQSGEITNKKILNQISRQKQYNTEGQNNYWTGSTKPKVTIVEFGDFACPFCKNSFNKIREISVKYKNDVKIIFRDYPMHKNSLELALAGRCAGEQGLFWLMHDKLFQNQENINNTNQLSELANQIGVDLTKFNKCLSDKKYLLQIQKDFADGEKLKVKGTPTWFINGYKIEGDIPYKMFIDLVEDLIQKNN